MFAAVIQPNFHFVCAADRHKKIFVRVHCTKSHFFFAPVTHHQAKVMAAGERLISLGVKKDPLVVLFEVLQWATHKSVISK